MFICHVCKSKCIKIPSVFKIGSSLFTGYRIKCIKCNKTLCYSELEVLCSEYSKEKYDCYKDSVFCEIKDIDIRDINML